MTYIGGEWYMKTTLRKMKRSKKAQDKYDIIKRNLQASNQNWNDWKFQIHWNMLEWVNPRSKILRKTTEFFKMIERLIGNPFKSKNITFQ